jgi:outer membrane protein insertion porin family
LAFVLFLGLAACRPGGSGESFFEDTELPGDPGTSANLPETANIGGPDAEGAMVTAIEVMNTVTTTPEQIIYRMSTRVGHPLNERVLDGDFQRLAGMGFFDDVQIKKEFDGAGVKIVVVVREKDIIRRIQFTGNQQIRTRRLTGLIESKVGERFDAGKGNRDRRAIEDFLHKEYYYFGEVRVDTEPFEDGILLNFTLDEGGRLYVADIEFRGNTVFTRKALLAKMETKRSGLISRGKYLRRNFERDLERIRMSYLDKGYLDVKVTERPFEVTANTPSSRWQRRDAYLHVDIEEGEQYRVGRVDFDFVGSSLVSEERIRQVIRTMPGEVYSPIMIQEDAIKIREIYGQAPNSRYFTRVFPDPQITEDGLVMDVAFRIQEGPEVMVEGVRVTGLTHTKEVVVLREFELFPGEKIDSRKFTRSRENIENLGYFKERPNIEIREGSAPNRAIMVAELEEIPTGKITAGVGVSSQDSIVGSFGISQRNFDYRDRPKSLRDLYTGKSFRGAGQSFSINVSAGSKSQSHSVSFTNPWIFGKPISMTASLFYSSYKYDDDPSDYHETRYGASLIFGKRLFDLKELTVSGGYRLEMVKMSHFSEGYYGRDIGHQKGSHNVSRWLAGINYDSRDSVFEPTRGSQAGLNLELAGTAAGSSKDFWRALFTSQYFIPFFTDSLDRNWSLGFRGDVSLAQAYGRGDGKSDGVDYSSEVPFFERFHAGGVGSLRGYDYRGVSPRDWRGNSIGGEAAATASVELFFPIWDRIIRGSAFYDVGTAWRYWDKPGYDDPYDKKDEYINSANRKIRTSFGFGLHIKTPLGPMPVRLYYAFPMGKQEHDETQRFQFTMGALF